MANTEPSAPGILERIRRFLGAWQPFTGRGLAAFVPASFGRVMALQLMAAGGIALLVVSALRVTWVPVLANALPALPESAGIVGGRLVWPETSARRLAENPWLSIVVRPESAGSDVPGQSADLQIELHPGHLRLTGVFGLLERPYPRTWRVDLGRIAVTAAVKAWYMPGCWIVAGAVGVFLLVSWWGLATLYTPAAWILARLTGRAISLPEAWRIAAAALFSGAALGAFGVAAYASGAIRLPGLIVTQVLHVPVPWVWLLWGLLSLPTGPARPRVRKENPFAS